jgi:hypothetical protein
MYCFLREIKQIQYRVKYIDFRAILTVLVIENCKFYILLWRFIGLENGGKMREKQNPAPEAGTGLYIDYRSF